MKRTLVPPRLQKRATTEMKSVLKTRLIKGGGGTKLFHRGGAKRVCEIPWKVEGLMKLVLLQVEQTCKDFNFSKVKAERMVVVAWEKVVAAAWWGSLRRAKLVLSRFFGATYSSNEIQVRGKLIRRTLAIIKCCSSRRRRRHLRREL